MRKTKLGRLMAQRDRANQKVMAEVRRLGKKAAKVKAKAKRKADRQRARNKKK